MSDDPSEDPDSNPTRSDDASAVENRDDADEKSAADRGVSESPESNPFERLEDTAPEREGDPFERLSSPGTSSDASPSRDGPTTEGEPHADTESAAHDSHADPSSRAESREPTSGDADAQMESFEPEPTPGTLDPGQHSSDGPGSAFSAGSPDSRAGSDTGSGDSVPDPGGRDLETDSFGPTQRTGDPFESLEGAFKNRGAASVDPDAVWDTLDRAESVEDTPQRTYSEVSKHSYCEHCEYFSAPPEIQCRHEGTEIVEFPDSETVRVVDCPVVAQRQHLDDE